MRFVRARDPQITTFLIALDHRVSQGDVPEYLQDNPLLLGQVVHSVIGGCAVYLLPVTEQGSDIHYMKIGVARNIEQRMRTIRTSLPLPLGKAMYFCVGPFKQALELERELHSWFDDCKWQGEWFCFECKEDMDKGVLYAIDRADEFLGIDANSFVFDFDDVDNPDVPAARAFAKAIWDAAGKG